MIAVIVVITMNLIQGFSAIKAPEVIPSSRTSSSLLVQFDEFSSADGGVNIAYEMAYKSMVNSAWNVVDPEGFNSAHRNVAYLISVQVDTGATITTGYFQLAFGHSSTLPADSEIPTYSLLIPYDASVEQLTAALGNIQGITVNEVTRCQPGYDSIPYPCPKATQGAYQWLIFLNTPITLSTNLYVLRSNLGGTWSGPGEQVQISQFQRAMTSTNQCFEGRCRVNATSLLPSMGYSFRVRVLSTLGWSDYSPSSMYAFTLEARRPSRLAAPITLTSTASFVTMQIPTPSSLEAVSLIESQYRQVGTNSWTTGPTLDVSALTLAKGRVVTLRTLQLGTMYEMRIRALNSYGYGPYSAASDPFTLAGSAAPTVSSVDSLFTLQNITSSSVNVFIQTNFAILTGTATYGVQHRSPYDTEWTASSSPPRLTSTIPGVIIQSISTRSDTNTSSGCEGYFQLSMGTVDPTLLDQTVTTPLYFTASITEMAAALQALYALKSTSIGVVVRRQVNSFNGYTWTVEISGASVLVPINVYKTTLVSRVDNSSQCFSYGSPVVTEITADGSPTLQTQNATVVIASLKPQTLYSFRLNVVTTTGLTYTSNAKNATTLVAIVQTTPSQVTMPSVMNAPVGGSTLDSANGSQAARQHDFYYMQSTANGGTIDSIGQNGYCVAILHDLYKVTVYRAKSYFFTGFPQVLSAPSSSNTTSFVTFKCWGAGGGGAKSSPGGGGAFSQITVRVSRGDVFQIQVGGGGGAPAGEDGGVGGYNGGGNGGKSFGGGGGGGGGGCSSITLNGVVILVAAGGGGAGSTNYCCADGGSAGGSTGTNGTYPGNHTPWPISEPGALTPVLRRYEYTASTCPNSTGSWCISEWDTMPHSLPALSEPLEYGATPYANFSAWSMPGGGGSAYQGGVPGDSGSYVISKSTNELVTYGVGLAAIYSLIDGLETKASQGLSLIGGNGADGHDAGGGGGAGWFGGGGGGSGIDGAGGGGGSSYFDADLVAESDSVFASAAAIDKSLVIIGTPQLVTLNDTSVTFSWFYDKNKASSWGVPLYYQVECSAGPRSDDFLYWDTVYPSPTTASPIVKEVYTAGRLLSASPYRFRIVPVFTKGAAAVSPPLPVVTFPPASNYWELILPRRYSRAATGRGFSDPVVDRPHIDYPLNANITSQNSSDFASDSPTASSPMVPSGRRGHSLTLVDNFVYMIGGRTVGYPCASAYKDYTNYQTSAPLQDITPCATSAGEVNEVWTLDINTYEWNLIQVNSSLPSAREQHAACKVDGDIYILGGKQFDYSNTSNGDVIYNDIWRLNVQHNTSLNFGTSDAGQRIPDDTRLLLSANSTGAPLDVTNARAGLCVEDIKVNVVLRHPCANQLRISLLGPGPSASSANYHPSKSAEEVILFSLGNTNLTGCVAGPLHNFTFSDQGELNTFDCCPSVYEGSYKSEGRLSTFLRASPYANWTLIVQDMRPDTMSGTMVSWSLELTVSPCTKAYSWTQIIPIGATPPPRYQGRVIAVNSSIFLFGGRSYGGSELSDLWRFDLKSAGWTSLSPSNFDTSLRSFAYGQSVAIVPSGIVQYGGYTSSLQFSSANSIYTYGSQAIMVDLYSKQRTVITRNATVAPLARYLSAAVYIPSRAVAWRKLFSSNYIYDQSLLSTHTNFAGSLMDSYLVIGGDNGVSGITRDGSSGGLLGDIWMLRMAEQSTIGSRNNQQRLHERSCSWRQRSPFAGKYGTADCFGGVGSNCNFEAILKSAWCAGIYQNV